jgi:hypothetical protein
MNKLRVLISVLILALVSFSAPLAKAQTATDASKPTDEEKQKEKEALEKKATALLEEIINEVQLLKLPENRIRVQIAAGDLLWKGNESRARSMFSIASDGVAELMRSSDNNSRRWASQLRQELVLAAAQHDAPLAYQFISATRPPLTGTDDDARRAASDVMLEQSLLALISRVDPKFAAQKAEEALDKGQFPISVARVLTELQPKDKEAFTKLSEKVVSSLQSANLLASSEAGALALSLLQPGPRPATTATDNPPADPTVPNNRTSIMPVLGQSAFTDVIGAVIDAALKATSPSATQRASNQRGAGNARVRGPGSTTLSGSGDAAQLTDAQIEQNNARRLLVGLQPLLTQIDQYAPARSSAVRQKLADVSGANNPRTSMAQYGSLMQQGTSESLLAAAPVAPPQVQPRIYQQAALKALAEGNVDQARQIANDHLDQRARDSVLQRVEFQIIANKVEAENMDQLRQALAQLHSDDERIDLLVQMAGVAQKKDKKLAIKLLTEAQRLANRRATSYRQFDQQLAVADAFSTLDPVRSFETLDSGIAQLNELLSAAAVLSGFEVTIFRDGEMPLEPNSQLTSMVARYSQQLAWLAKTDFERAELSAGKFQLAEPRLLVRLYMVRSLLGAPQAGGFMNSFGNRNFVRRTQ